MKKYKVVLTKHERELLDATVKKEHMSARKRVHAQILLRTDEAEGHGWNDVDTAEAYGVGLRTVERIRERFVEDGFEAALQSKAEQKNRARKFDGTTEAKLVTLACGNPPKGYARWTLQLLADRMVALKYAESISHQSVFTTLKKTNLSLGRAKSGV